MVHAKGYTNRVAGYFNALLSSLRRKIRGLFVPEVVEVEVADGKKRSAYTYKVLAKE